MQNSRATLILGLFGLMFLLGACAGNKAADSNSLNANAVVSAATNAEIVPQDNIEELAKIIKLNLPPEEATYYEINPNTKNSEPNVPAPNERKIVAVLRFSTENAAQIVAAAEKYKPAAPSDTDAENWFPVELIAQSQLTGDESLKGLTYAANDFFQMPYNNGKLTRINNTDYFILELTTF